MSGGMGGGGVSDKGSVPTDLEAIYQGGQYFLERMKAMAAAREQHDAAFLALQIGQDARRALDESAVKLAAAEVARVAADETLDAAKAEAKRIVDEASDAARRIRGDVSAWSDNMRASGEKARADADEYAKAKKAEADAASAKAIALRDELKTQVDAARKAENVAAAAKRVAQEADAAAVEREAALNKKIAALHEAITRASES